MQWKIHIVDEISDLPLTFLSYCHTINFLSSIEIFLLFLTPITANLLKAIDKNLVTTNVAHIFLVDSVASGFP